MIKVLSKYIFIYDKSVKFYIFIHDKSVIKLHFYHTFSILYPNLCNSTAAPMVYNSLQLRV